MYRTNHINPVLPGRPPVSSWRVYLSDNSRTAFCPLLISWRVIWRVDLQAVLDGVGLGAYPAGLVGCRADGTHHASCSYDLVVFDGSHSPPRVVQYGDRAVILYRGSLQESRTPSLAGYLSMNIIRDDSMELAPFLSGVVENRDALLTDLARSNLAEAILCAQRATIALEGSVDMGSCWQKCSSLYLGDAILALSGRLPTSHALAALRDVRGNRTGTLASTGTLGMERASSTLLTRMTESAAGLSGMVGGTPPEIIRLKAGALLAGSRIPDCYRYLCGVARQCLSATDSIRGGADVEYVAPMALDAERDAILVRGNAARVRGEASRMLEVLAHA